jgi:phage/plasmid-associated DNA primase
MFSPNRLDSLAQVPENGSQAIKSWWGMQKPGWLLKSCNSWRRCLEWMTGDNLLVGIAKAWDGCSSHATVDAGA